MWWGSAASVWKGTIWRIVNAIPCPSYVATITSTLDNVSPATPNTSTFKMGSVCNWIPLLKAVADIRVHSVLNVKRVTTIVCIIVWRCRIIVYSSIMIAMFVPLVRMDLHPLVVNVSDLDVFIIFIFIISISSFISFFCLRMNSSLHSPATIFHDIILKLFILLIQIISMTNLKVIMPSLFFQ